MNDMSSAGAEFTDDFIQNKFPEYKDQNPKDAIGSSKVPLSLVPLAFQSAVALGLLEGREKYGLVNWRAAPVRASVYLDAALRHIGKYIEGENFDLQTHIPHLGNAGACLAILIDAYQQGTLIDDRPLSNVQARNLDQLIPKVQHIKELFKDKNPKDWTIEDKNTANASSAVSK